MKICKALVVLQLLIMSFIPLRAAKKIILKEGSSIDLFNTPHAVFVINGHVNLEGREIQIPENSAIKFNRKGCLINGVLIGNNTKIKGLKKGCLAVIMKGKWKVSVIKDVFFDWGVLSDNQIMDNITAVQSDKIYNTIYLDKPEYHIVLNKGHTIGLSLKSNATLINRSLITIAGNDLPKYTIVSVTKDNIRIKGGQIIGDIGKHTYIEGTSSEWGFGISISKGSNVTISDLRISKCTGDGVYIGGGRGTFLGDYIGASKNIVLRNIIAEDNRRQGISITYADGVRIENCVFSNTGKTEYTAPGFGLDIEPNDGQSVRNVTFKRCQFHNNNPIVDASIGGYKTDGDKCNVELVRMEDCTISGTLSIQTGSVVLRNCSMASLALRLDKMPKGKVLIDKCRIIGGAGVTIRSEGKTTDINNLPVYSFDSCILEMNTASTKAMFSKINHRGNEVAEFNVSNCIITLPDGIQDYNVIQPNDTCSFLFVGCEIRTHGRTINVEDKRFQDCIFVPDIGRKN